MYILKNFLLYFFLIEITFGITNAVAEPVITQGNIYKQLTAIKCDSLIKANDLNPNFVILDVRTSTEWSSYHLLGSINRSTGLADFDTQLAALPKQKLYLLHCQSGGRSAGAFAKMKTLGFAEVYEMIGGLNAWNNAKLPTTTVSGPKLMIVSVVKNTKNKGNDTTMITVTNRANSVLTFSNLSFTDVHNVQTNFYNLKTMTGAEDYSFYVIHPSGMGDSTHVSLASNGGTVSFAIGNSLSTNSVSNSVAEFRLYPNPVSGRLFFDAGAATIEEITISDLTGKHVYSVQSIERINNIDVSEFKNGIYIARIKTNEKIITRKFVVKR